MNLTMKLTFDGLVRALRWKMHDLAEDRREDYRRKALSPQDKRDAAQKQRRAEEGQDDRTGI